MMRYVVDLDGRQFTVALGDGAVSVGDARPVPAHIEQVEGTPVWLVTLGGSVHRVTARRAGARGRYVLRINGRRFAVDALDERTRAIRDLADANRPASGPGPVRAPMPGLIVRVHVAAGETVRAGQPLLAIEAMKMENELRAPAAGTVRAVQAVPGTAVEKGAVRVEFA